MQSNITALLFDFTKENLDKYKTSKINVSSGENILKELLHFAGEDSRESPFAQLIDIDCDPSNNRTKDEQMSNILGIDKSNLCFYQIYTHSIKNSRMYTMERLNRMAPGEITILANKSMFEKAVPLFEIRYKMDDKWSSWHAITGKFIVTQTFKYGPGGMAETYSPITEREIEHFKQNFQIRYSGSITSELVLQNTLPRIINDPSNSDIRKIIDPNTFQILFDSQIMQDVSREESHKLWENFEERYR